MYFTPQKMVHVLSNKLQAVNGYLQCEDYGPAATASKEAIELLKALRKWVESVEEEKKAG